MIVLLKKVIEKVGSFVVKFVFVRNESKPLSKGYYSCVKAGLFGVAVGDALGVPFQFYTRENMKESPVVDLVGYGVYNQPVGTFSDDSSLTFCLAESLILDFDLNRIGGNYVKWYYKNYWTARGNVFDVGISTRLAIERIAVGYRCSHVGCVGEFANGNGSLMRILPLVFYLLDKPFDVRYKVSKQVCSITHGNVRCVIACFYYLEFARQLVYGLDKFEIYDRLQSGFAVDLLSFVDIEELKVFSSLLNYKIHLFKEDNICSTGYVVDTLESSIWCLLTTDCYKDAVLKAVNLGDDTDTTGAVTGGLAGLLYGFDSIPCSWVKQLARTSDIDCLAKRLAVKLVHD